MPKLSVIIPVYNAENTIARCLDSLLAQSLTDIEILCVDDGSADGSLDVLRSYEKKDARVRAFTQPNSHAGVARNKGLNEAQGEYLYFLDSDDYVLPYALEAAYNKVVKYDLDVLRFAAVCIDLQSGGYVDLARNSLTRLMPGDFMRLVDCSPESPVYKGGVAPWLGICRRSFILEHEITFDDLICVNDRAFYYAAVTNAKRMMISRDRVAYHIVNQDSSLRGIRAKNFDCHFRSIERVAGRLQRDGLPEDVVEKVMDEEFFDLFVFYRRFCDGSELGDQIAAQTAEFMENYDGPGQDSLKARYEDAVEKIKKARGKAPAPAKQLKIYHESSERPKVSVIVPVYNVEDYLNEALNSLTVQTLEEMEFLCINDGSTDNSLTILREYAALDQRFKIFDGPNGGYGKGMNRGIDASRAEYIGILEPDDFVPPEMFGELYDAAKKHDADIVKADFYRFRERDDGTFKKNHIRLSKDKSYYNRVLCPVETPEVYRFPMNTWSGIYKLDFLNKWDIRHHETPGASYQDNGFWFKTFSRAKRLVFVDKPYYMNRRDNPNSSMASKGKMYAVTEEFRLLGEWLKQDPDLYEKVQKMYYSKKLYSFFITLYRLAPELQDTYVHHMYDEFREPYEKELLDKEFLSVANWRRFCDIMEDPDGYIAHLCVSVIMPVYNAGRVLRQTLDSLLGRNEINFEVICVDDGSSDDSLAILREYEEKDARVRVIAQENAGAGTARNTGMQYAKGEYLLFLDSDDFFETKMVRVAYDRAHLNGADLVVFGSDHYMEDEHTFKPLRYSIKKGLLPKQEPFAGSDIEKNIFRAFIGWPWDKLYRADFIRENGIEYQNLRTTNDMLFVFSAVVKAERICTMPTVLVHHRRAGGSLSVTREKSWGCFYEALCALRGRLKEWELYERREQDFVNYSLHFALWNLTTLTGESYYKLYDQLKEEWFADLGITAHDKNYFYDRFQWEASQKILTGDPDAFAAWYGEEKRRQQQRAAAQSGSSKSIKQRCASVVKKAKRAAGRVKRAVGGK